MALNEHEQRMWDQSVASLESIDTYTDTSTIDAPVSLVFDKLPQTVADLSLAFMDNYAKGAIDLEQFERGLQFCEYLMDDDFSQEDRADCIEQLPIVEYDEEYIVTLQL